MEMYPALIAEAPPGGTVGTPACIGCRVIDTDLSDPTPMRTNACPKTS